MRFDDSLATVLAADSGSAVGAAAAWRQLCDLVGRDRVADVTAAVARLRDLRPRVPAAVRGASGRALTRVERPPAALVALFAEDDLAIAAPVLRTAQLDSAEWLALLPRLTPATRSVLRHRRDLPGDVARGLQSFGATDFVLAHDAEPSVASAEAPEPEAFIAEPAPPPKQLERAAPGFEIADVLARIKAVRRDRPAVPVDVPSARADAFQFHTDASGTIRWVEGVARAPLIGLRLNDSSAQGAATLQEAIAVGQREAFRTSRLLVTGDSSAAGTWALAGEPRFDRATGRFTGFAGTARRVTAAPVASSAADTLRQLVHELRTPANAISGFAELIGTELLGPVAPVYRERAGLIQRQASGLTCAIADLDTAARIEGNVLDTKPASIDLAPMLARIAADLQPMARATGVALTYQAQPHVAAQADERAAGRLIERLLTVVVAAAAQGERVHAQLVAKPRSVRLHITRPRALPIGDDSALLAIDPGEGGDDALPLGVGFTLRLVRGLAAATGGS